MSPELRSFSAIDGVLIRRPIRLPDGGGGGPIIDPVVPGVPEDISLAVYRTTLDWKANYGADTAAMIASYEGPDQDVKLATPGASLTLVADPLTPGATRKFMRCIQPNGTATTNGVTSSPRMQIEDPRRVVEGDAFWTAMTYIFPTVWPVVGTTDGFIQVYQFYGAPFGGGATITLTFRADGPHDTPDILRWGFNRDNANIATGLGWKWQTVRGIYVDIAMRIVAGRKDPRTDDTAGIFFPAKGSVEIWMNVGDGWEQQTLIGGVTRLDCATIGSVNTTGPNSNEMQLYRRLDAFPEDLTLYIGGHARGRTLASVDPKSYNQPKPPVANFVVGVTKPTAANTGAGTLLNADGTTRPAPSVVFNGDKTLTGGMILKDLIINGQVFVTGSNNIIENCVIRGKVTRPTGNTHLVQCSNSINTRVRHCDLRPQTPSYFWNAIGTKNYVIDRCDISHITDGFSAFSTAADKSCNIVIRANYCHDMVQFRPDPPNGNRAETHNDWWQGQSNGIDHTDIVIVGNYMNARFIAAYDAVTFAAITPNQTNRACIMIAPISNGTTGLSVSATVENNWFDGGVYTINGGGNNTGSRMIVRGNRFERPSATVGGVTRSLVLDATITRVDVSGNVYSDDGSPVPVTNG